MTDAPERREILRYWLAALRHESTGDAGFSPRPEAEARGPFEPDLVWPAADWSYFTVPIDDEGPDDLADFLLRRAGDLGIAPLGAPHAAVFERWLARLRRRALLRRSGAPWLESTPDLQVGFPVVRTGHGRGARLAPLLTLPVAPRWLDAEGRPWSPLDPAAGHVEEAPPGALRLELRPAAEVGLPYRVETNLLARAGLDPHTAGDLDARLEEGPALAPEQVLAGVATLLRRGSLAGFDDEAATGGDPADLLDGLAAALQGALGAGRAHIEPWVAVYEAAGGSPTARLREEVGRIAALADVPLPVPLRVFLGDTPPAAGRTPHLGLAAAELLTPSQEDAAEQALATPFAAVEGPPGTGKTALIQALAADCLVRNAVSGVYDDVGVVPETLVVTSTNNQAVDNALDPLAGGSTLPLGLRLGNQQVLATRTAGALQRVEAALAAAEPTLAREDLEEARERLDALHGRLLEALEAGRPAEDLAPLRRNLLAAALEVRDAWARARRDDLLTLLRQSRRSGDAPRWQAWWIEDPEVRMLATAAFPVVGTTLLSLGLGWPLEEEALDHLVVDEAGQCPAPYLVPALYRCRRATMVGDVHQLPPIVDLASAEEAALRRRLSIEVPEETLGPYRMSGRAPASAQSVAESNAPGIRRLREHFRCPPEIIGISERLCDYDLDVRTPRRDGGAAAEVLRGPVVLAPVRGTQRAWGRSQQNPQEAVRVVDLVRRLLDAGLPPSELGLVTPYRGQFGLLRRRLQRAGVPVGGWSSGALPTRADGREAVLLGTIHRLQGGERDVVILSMVARRARSLAWLEERPNLLNVAVSRARAHLVIVGDPDVLAQGPHGRRLLEAAPPEDWLTG
ncbi:MAG: DEAD/DEAH box helicase [Myxococcota bacterium]